VRFPHNGTLQGLDRWLTENIHGRYAVTVFEVVREGTLCPIVVIAFESVQDAVMFRLKEGETAWHPKDSDIF
jgi:hypothetical protein